MTPWSISARRNRAAGLLYGQEHLLNTLAATATMGHLASRGAAAGLVHDQLELTRPSPKWHIALALLTTMATASACCSSGWTIPAT
jgi:hypothetical protein